MILSCIGLPQDRSGVYGQCQDWLQNHGLGVYEPQRRYGDGTLFNEWTGAGFGFRLSTLAMLCQQSMNMLLHCSRYYFINHPQILRNAIPNLTAMRDALDIPRPWFMVDEPPHFALDANGNQRFGWTPAVEDVVVDFVGAAMAAGFEVGVCMPGQTQYAFWRARITPTFWIFNDQATTGWAPLPGCWLYNASTYTGLAERMRVVKAAGYLQWSGVTTTKQGPVPILFDAAGVATDAAWELVRQLGQAQEPATLEERVAALERRVAALEAG